MQGTALHSGNDLLHHAAGNGVSLFSDILPYPPPPRIEDVEDAVAATIAVPFADDGSAITPTVHPTARGGQRIQLFKE